MAYTTDGITPLAVIEQDGGVIVRAACSHADKTVQLYVSGRLAAWAVPRQGTVEFALPLLRDTDVLMFLAVDAEEAACDYWDQAPPAAVEYGHRIRVRTPRLVQGYLPSDRWRVYLGAAGEAQADVLVHEQDFYPQGRGACGYGSVLGDGYGYDGAEAAGYGEHYGSGEYGLDCEMLEWVSDPLWPGDYPVRVAVRSVRGEESTMDVSLVALTTYPRPAAGLAVDSYDRPTDILELSWAQSPDIVQA